MESSGPIHLYKRRMEQMVPGRSVQQRERLPHVGEGETGLHRHSQFRKAWKICGGQNFVGIRTLCDGAEYYRQVGQPAKDIRYFTVYAAKDKTPYSHMPFEFQAVDTD